MTAGSIIAGGFGLVRRHPGAVVVWALIYLVATVGMALAMPPIMDSLALGWLLSAVAGSLSIALFGGAVAIGARHAVGGVDGLSDTFA